MVHYQSRAQVPAPCVGKPRRPPVLQVSTIQTPRRRQDAGEGRGEAPGRAAAAARAISLFLFCGENSRPGAKTHPWTVAEWPGPSSSSPRRVGEGSV